MQTPRFPELLSRLQWETGSPQKGLKAGAATPLTSCHGDRGRAAGSRDVSW